MSQDTKDAKHIARSNKIAIIFFIISSFQDTEKLGFIGVFAPQLNPTKRNKSVTTDEIACAMKSALRQDIGADLISSEAKSRGFHPSSLGFHRGKATISFFLSPRQIKTQNIGTINRANRQNPTLIFI
jgi:hypothetical protein